MKNIKEIRFPNTVPSINQHFYIVSDNSFGVDNIEAIQKESGTWFSVTKDDEVIAEIKESICNVYGYEKTLINNEEVK